MLCLPPLLSLYLCAVFFLLHVDYRCECDMQRLWLVSVAAAFILLCVKVESAFFVSKHEHLSLTMYVTVHALNTHSLFMCTQKRWRHRFAWLNVITLYASVFVLVISFWLDDFDSFEMQNQNSKNQARTIIHVCYIWMRIRARNEGEQERISINWWPMHTNFESILFGLFYFHIAAIWIAVFYLTG